MWMQINTDTQATDISDMKWYRFAKFTVKWGPIPVHQDWYQSKVRAQIGPQWAHSSQLNNVLIVYTMFTQHIIIGVVVTVVTSPPRELRSIAISMFVCLSVWPHTSKTTCPSFTKFSVHVTCGRRLVLLWWQCNMLCTTDFVDDMDVASAAPLSALPPIDWHPSTISLAVHNGVWLWRRIMCCASGKVCHPRLSCCCCYYCYSYYYYYY